MFIKSFFPSTGGGTVRRWWKLQKGILNKMSDSEHPAPGPMVLFDFSDRNDAVDAANVAPQREGAWRISDDEVIGGFSRATMKVIRTKEDLRRVERGEEPVPFTNIPLKEELPPIDDGFTPFIRWKGRTDTRLGASSSVDRTGFCAIQSPPFPIIGYSMKHKFNAVEIKCRSDGRQYLINMRIDTMFPGDLYQAVLAIRPTLSDENKDPTVFSKAIFPFDRFLHTARGRVRVVQRMLDSGPHIETIGFTIMDGDDADFQFDLASIRLVNYIDGKILGEDDDLAPY